MIETQSAKSVLPNGSQRLHEIDGMRATAALLVVIHHFATSGIVLVVSKAGFGKLAQLISLTTNSGVELFFVLSGVVLLRPFLRGLRPFAAQPYFRRRVERLWPPYAAALVLGSAVILIASLHPTWYSKQVLPAFSVSGVARQVAIVNFGWPIYNLAWWSLTPELLFYLVAPLVVALLAVRGMRQPMLLGLIGAASILSALLWNEKTSMPGVQSGFVHVGLQFLAYLPCFMVGATLAKFDIDSRGARALLGVGIAYLILALYLPRLNVHAAFGLIYGAIVCSAMRRGGILNAILTAPTSVWLGERSYSLFLVHFSILYFCDYFASLVLHHRGVAYAISTRLFGFILSVLVAMTIFSLVERRFARGLTTAEAFWPWQVLRTRATAPAMPSPVNADVLTAS